MRCTKRITDRAAFTKASSQGVYPDIVHEHVRVVPGRLPVLPVLPEVENSLAGAVGPGFVGGVREVVDSTHAEAQGDVELKI